MRNFNITQNHNIFLIGPMGAGKTSVGSNLAKLLSLTFYDTDHELQKQTGVTLAWILQLEQEKGLRIREHKVLQSLVRKKNILLATGGGTVVSPENRTLLKKNGLIIYLRTPLDIQQKRTRFSKENRPLLDIGDLPSRIQELHKKREPLYRTLAQLTYGAKLKSPHKLALEIFNDLQKQNLIV